MFEKNLIKEVQKYCHLYDRNSLLYNSRVKRKATWKKISTKLNTPVKICDMKWRCLRDRFVKEFKRFLECGEKSYAYIKWKHYDEMHFLVNHIRSERSKNKQKTKTNRNTEPEKEVSNSEGEDEVVYSDDQNNSEDNFLSLDIECKDADVQLIQEVRKRSLLYDKNNNKYFDKSARDHCWTEIGKLLECSATMVKKRWRMLRDHFVRDYNKNQSYKACKRNNEATVTWGLYDQMLFLQDYVATNIIFSADENPAAVSDEENTFDETALDVPHLFTMQLITEVKKYECLLISKLNNKRKRIIAWTRISAKLKTPAIVLQTKWRNLRDRFVKEYTKKPQSSKWQYFEELKFLHAYIRKKKNDDEFTDLVSNNGDSIGFEEEAVMMDITCQKKSEQKTNPENEVLRKNIFDLKLINEVKQFEEIYVTTNVNYRNTRRLAATWDEISANLNTTAQRCRFRWRYLRDRFVKEHVRYEKYGQFNEIYWDLYKDLLFIKDYIQVRRKVLFNYDTENEISADEETPTISGDTELLNCWERIDCKELIKEIKKRPMLYKREYINFRYRKERALAWTEISERLECSAQHCQVKWRGLRKRYIRECFKMEELQKIGETPLSDWPYIKQMEFISDHLRKKISKTETNYNLENAADDEDFENENDIEWNDFIEEIFEDDNNEAANDEQNDNIYANDTTKEAMQNSTEKQHIKITPINNPVQTFIEIDTITHPDNEDINNLSYKSNKFSTFIPDNVQNYQKHLPFVQMVSYKLAQLPLEKQEEAKMYFLNFLQEKRKNYWDKQKNLS